MSAALYDKARESFLKGGELAWATDNVKALFVDAGAYTVDLAAHQFLSDIPSGARIAASANLANKTTAAGVADADDVTITVPASQPSIEAIVLYQDTGSAATSRLIAYIDSGSGLPFTPAAGGADILVQWPSGASRIFKL